MPEKFHLSLILLTIVHPDGNQTIFSRALLDADFGPVKNHEIIILDKIDIFKFQQTKKKTFLEINLFPLFVVGLPSGSMITGKMISSIKKQPSPFNFWPKKARPAKRSFLDNINEFIGTNCNFLT